MTGKLPWDAARQKCERGGGYLACIGSEDENNFVAGLTAGRSAWLGGRIKPGGKEWVWLSGEEFKMDRWETGQPSGGEQERSLHILPNGCWNDASPSFSAIEGFVCEWDR